MQMCPFCDKVYDESDYSHCPYCSGEIEEDTSERPYKDCPQCGGIMYWDGYTGGYTSIHAGACKNPVAR